MLNSQKLNQQQRVTLLSFGMGVYSGHSKIQYLALKQVVPVIKQLVEMGLIKKTKRGYALTKEGLKTYNLL